MHEGHDAKFSDAHTAGHHLYMPGSTCTASNCWQRRAKWWPVLRSVRSEAFCYLKAGEQPQFFQKISVLPIINCPQDFELQPSQM